MLVVVVAAVVVSLSICLSASLRTKLFCETSSVVELGNIKTQQFSETSLIFELDNVKNEAILRDFLIFLKLTTSKTKQFCETSFKNGKLSAELTVSYQCVFAIFPLHLSKLLRLPRKSDARSYEVLHLSRKMISANLKIWCSKMQPLSGNQRPDLLTALMNMSLVLRPRRKMDLCRSSSNVPRLPSFLDMPQIPHVLLIFDTVHNPLRLPRETTFERPRVVRACGAFNMCTSKCALRHNGMHFFDITTSKSGPDLVCFVHFDFEMCFALQWRAIFRHLNFQKCFDPVSFLHFWLRNVLRATTACTFSTSQLPKVVWTWCALCILTSKCALRHNGVHSFDISTSKSALIPSVFYTFDFETCFAPQRRAIFHLSSGQLAPHPPL